MMECQRTTANAARRSRGGRTIFLRGCVMICAILLLETVARLLYTVHKNFASSDWYVCSRTMHWARRPGFSGSILGTHRNFDEHGYFSIDTDSRHAHDRYKILLLGDSCTFGARVMDKDTFGEVLEQTLPNTSVINLGVPGYTSFQGLQALREPRPTVADRCRFHLGRVEIPDGT